jgi:hypothetical protein
VSTSCIGRIDFALAAAAAAAALSAALDRFRFRRRIFFEDFAAEGEFEETVALSTSLLDDNSEEEEEEGDAAIATWSKKNHIEE